MTTQDFWLKRNGWAPNNSAAPAILYRGCLPAGSPEATAAAFERLFASNGWPPQWRDGVFDYHHYHSTAHEVLGFAAGWARLILGGPGGAEVWVEAGDAVLLPAGTGHCRIEQSADFLVVGAYPTGQSFDVRRTAPSPQALAAMAALGVPPTDPVEGGPLTRLSRGSTP